MKINMHFNHFSLNYSYYNKCLKVVEKIKTHILGSKNFLPKIIPSVR